MNLALDIGNSYTHLGVFCQQSLLYTSKLRTSDVIGIEKELIKIKSNYRIEKIGISSVVTEIEHELKKTVKNVLKIVPLCISGKIRLPIKLNIKNKEKLGADRICSSVAGYEFFKGKENVIIIDLGTATTYDVVLRNGEFIGGVISPGIETSAKALNISTSELPLLTLEELNFPRTSIGKTTVMAIKSGIMYSALDSMEGMVKRIEKNLNRKFRIILTGGFAKKIKNKTALKVLVKENLVIEGVNLILRFHNAH
jgi:type III pantothenate kinase